MFDAGRFFALLLHQAHGLHPLRRGRVAQSQHVHRQIHAYGLARLFSPHAGHEHTQRGVHKPLQCSGRAQRLKNPHPAAKQQVARSQRQRQGDSVRRGSQRSGQHFRPAPTESRIYKGASGHCKP